MIEKDINFNKLNHLFELYKENYNLTINDFTHNLVYKLNNEYISFLIYTVIYENIEIVDFYTAFKYRNKGIGTKLLNNLLIENNAKNITLEVNKLNESAIKLYNKMGFKKVAIRKGYYNGIDGYLMLKK